MKKLKICVSLVLIFFPVIFGCMPTPIVSEVADIPLSRGTAGAPGAPGVPTTACTSCGTLQTGTLANFCALNKMDCDANGIINIRCDVPCVVYSSSSSGTDFYSPNEDVRCDAAMGKYFIRTTPLRDGGIACG